MTERVCAIDGFEYAGKVHKAGDVFEVEDHQVEGLTLLGKIEPDEPNTEVEAEHVITINEDEDHEEITGTLHAKRKYTKRQAA